MVCLGHILNDEDLKVESHLRLVITWPSYTLSSLLSLSIDGGMCSTNYHIFWDNDDFFGHNCVSIGSHANLTCIKKYQCEISSSIFFLCVNFKNDRKKKNFHLSSLKAHAQLLLRWSLLCGVYWRQNWKINH